MTATRIADGIYKIGAHFYHRPKKPDGKRTWRSLDARTVKAAKLALQRATGDPLDSSLRVSEAIQVYLAAGCPDKRRQARADKYLTQEKARCKTLLKYWTDFQCARMTANAIDDYADWRIKNAKKGHGGRAADLDIVTLKNALRWSARKGLLQRDPFELITVSSYRNPKIRHCREVAPASGDELHQIAAHLFEESRGQVLGWLTLITAMVGGRVSEMTGLRIDAAPQEPGSVTDGILWLRRKKKGAHNFLKVHPVLRAALDEFFRWHRWRFAGKSPWWFPGEDISRPAHDKALTNALRRVGMLIAGARRTAHGLRSFYVTCRRSEGLSDAEIALETGQITGGREIVRTYGEATPHKVSWMPKEGKPAWEELYNFYTTTDPARPVSKTGRKVIPPRKGRLDLPVSAPIEKVL